MAETIQERREVREKASLYAMIAGAGVVVGVMVMLAFQFMTRPEPAPPAPVPVPDKPIVLPESIKIEAGSMTRLKAKVLADHSITWIVPPGSKLQTEAIGDFLIIACRYEGEYYVAAVTVVDKMVGEPVWTKVIVGKGGPAPPVPPPDPLPHDPLARQIQAAYARLADPQKGVKASYLSGVYRNGSDRAVKAAKTNGELFKILKSAVDEHLSPLDLKEIRELIAIELSTQLGTKADEPINYEPARLTLSHIADILEGLK